MWKGNKKGKVEIFPKTAFFIVFQKVSSIVLTCGIVFLNIERIAGVLLSWPSYPLTGKATDHSILPTPSRPFLHWEKN